MTEAALETRQETRIVDYRLTDAAIQTLSDKYLVLVVTDVEDTDQVLIIHDARLDIKDRRVKVEKQRKALKAESLAFGKKVDGAAKHIFGLLEPIESHLQAEEDKVKLAEDAKKAAEAEALRIETDRRRDALKEYNEVIPELQLSTMTWEEFENALFTAKEDWEEAKRVRDEQEEKRKAEDKRLADQKAAQDKKASDQKAAQDKLDADRKTMDAEKKRIADAEADKQAEEDAKDKVVERGFSIPHVSVGGNHEAAERDLKAKEREEEMQPDKTKLAAFLCKVQIAVSDVQCAPLSTTEAVREWSRSVDEIRATIDECKKRAEEL